MDKSEIFNFEEVEEKPERATLLEFEISDEAPVEKAEISTGEATTLYSGVKIELVLNFHCKLS